MMTVYDIIVNKGLLLFDRGGWALLGAILNKAKLNFDFEDVVDIEVRAVTDDYLDCIPATVKELVFHFPEMLLIVIMLIVWMCTPIINYYESNWWRRVIIYSVSLSVCVSIIFVLYAIYSYDWEKGALYVWYDSLSSDYFVLFVKFILLVFGLVVILAILFTSYDDSGYQSFLLLATLLPGFIAFVSVNDFLSFFAVVEYVSLITYVLPAIISRESDSIAASAKYYGIGAVASGMMLIGSVIVAAPSGSFNFDDLEYYWCLGNFETLQLFGLVLILCSFAMKITLFPAFTWVRDVYSGSPFLVILIFAVISKLSVISLFIRFYLDLWPWLYQHYVVPIFFLSILTIIGGVLGAFYAYVTNKVKAFIGYTSVNQIGYIFIGLCIVDSLDVVNAVIYYLTLYLVANTVFIGSFFYLSYSGYKIIRFEQLSLRYARYLGIRSEFIILAGLSVWAIAGLPPFGNFFAKITLWSSLIHLFIDYFYSAGTNYYLLFNPHFFIDLYSSQEQTPIILFILIFTSFVTSILSLYYYLGIIGIIISSRPLVEIRDENLKVHGLTGWLSILIVLIFVLSIWWGLVVTEPFSVPQFFIRYV